MLPVTHFLCLASLFVNIPVIMHLVNPYKLIFIRKKVTQGFEIWRIFTSFFLATTSGSVSYLIDLIILYVLAQQLESGVFAGRSADFAWQLILVGMTIIIVSLPFKTAIFTHPFLVALTCLPALLLPRSLVSLFGIFYIPASYTPYIMIGVDLLMFGPTVAVQDVVGLIVAYFWWWFIWAPMSIFRPFGRSPDWLRLVVE